MRIIEHLLAVVGAGVVASRVIAGLVGWYDPDNHRRAFDRGLIGLAAVRRHDRRNARNPMGPDARRAFERKWLKRKFWPAELLTDEEYEAVVGHPRIVLTPAATDGAS